MYESRASTVAESDSIAAVERSLSRRFACSSDTFCAWIVSAASRSLLADLRACARYDSCVLRISEQRHGENGERVEPGGVVRDRDHAADEAVDDVVREEPRKPLAERAASDSCRLDRDRERIEARVDDEVGDSCDETGDRDTICRSPDDGEDTGGGEGRERERADVEERVPQPGAPRAPVDARPYDRERRDRHAVRRAQRRRARRRR